MLPDFCIGMHMLFNMDIVFAYAARVVELSTAAVLKSSPHDAHSYANYLTISEQPFLYMFSLTSDISDSLMILI